MRVLHISASDYQGGAARAANRLHHGLRSIGVESAMLVRSRFTDDPSVLAPVTRVQKLAAQVRTMVDQWPLKLYDVDTFWSLAWAPHRISAAVRKFKPDVVHLHWICAGFLPVWALSSLRLPTVWTMHDCWPFTGGCHYTFGCNGYEHACGQCPQLHSTSTHDLSRWAMMMKRWCWEHTEFSLIAPSNWLAARARRSSLLQGRDIHVLPNGMDLDVLKPLDKRFARQVLNLPQDAKLVLYGAADPRDPNKGLQHLERSIPYLRQRFPKQRLGFVVFGTSNNSINVEPPFFSAAVGRLHNDRELAVLYSAADVTCVPSMEDNLPNVALESLACGTPVVAFSTSGLTDIVDHGRNGYLARAFLPEDLAAGIECILRDEERWRQLSNAARAKAVAAYDARTAAQRHVDLYQSLCGVSVPDRPCAIEVA